MRIQQEKRSRHDKEKIAGKMMKLEVAGKEERDLKATSGLGLAAGIEANKILPAGAGREPRSHASTQLCGLLAKSDAPH